MTIESIDQVRQAVQRARIEIYRAESAVGEMAGLCAGRLRNSSASHSTLSQLKKELANFDMRTGTWSDKP